VSLHQPFHDEGANKCIVYRIGVGQRSYDIYFRGASLLSQPGLEAALPLALLPAMRLGLPIHVEGAVSRTFCHGVERVISYFARSFDEFHQVPVTADQYYDARPETNGRTGSFFSGGVDSFYTLLNHQQQITDLVLIKGFDLSLRDEARLHNASQTVRAVADSMGIQSHEVETNAPVIIKDYGHWVHHGHGLVLAAVARLLAGKMECIWVPGSLPEGQQRPWGSSPFTDPEFSDERLSILHDAGAASRADKTAFIAKYPLALKYMRPCPDTKNDSRYNCCRCEKCIRTMVALYAVGALDNAEAFPLKLTPRAASRVLVLDEEIKMFWRENLALLEASPLDCEAYIKVSKALVSCSVKEHKRRFKWRRKRRHLLEKLKKAGRKLLNRPGGKR
jgi:hypothetical protein